MGNNSTHHHRLIPSYKGDEPYIFISYSHAYRSLARNMVNILNGMGYRVCNDEGQGQINMPEQYYKQVENCNVYVIILSPRTAASQRVRNEIRHITKKSTIILLEKRPTVLDPECSYYLTRGTLVKANKKCGNDNELLAEYMVNKLVPFLPEDVKETNS